MFSYFQPYRPPSFTIANGKEDLCNMAKSKWWFCDCCQQYILGNMYFVEKLESKDPQQVENYLEFCEACFMQGYNQNLLVTNPVLYEHRFSIDCCQHSDIKNKEIQRQKNSMRDIMYKYRNKTFYKSATTLTREEVLEDFVRTLHVMFKTPALTERENMKLIWYQQHLYFVDYMMFKEDYGRKYLKDSMTEEQFVLWQNSLNQYAELLYQYIFEHISKVVDGNWKEHFIEDLGFGFSCPEEWSYSTTVFKEDHAEGLNLLTTLYSS